MPSTQVIRSFPPEQSQAFYNNVRTDVITTLESLPDSTVKYLFRVIYASVVLGACGLISLLVLKLDYESQVESDSLLKWNTAVAVSGIVVLGTCFATHARRVHVVTLKGLRCWLLSMLPSVWTQAVSLCRWTFIIPASLAAAFGICLSAACAEADMSVIEPAVYIK